MIAKALLSTDHPVLAHIIPMRRCNLSCTYCNEYDKTSDPVPLHTMLSRIDRLGELGTAIVTISGGGPPMHPQLDPPIRRIPDPGTLGGLITNAFFLREPRLQR